MQKLYRFIVSGHVQGVGFRYKILEFARSKKLLGTVKNNPNGTVEIQLFGTAVEKDILETFCKESPGWAHVTTVGVQEITSEKKISEFQKLDRFEIVRE